MTQLTDETKLGIEKALDELISKVGTMLPRQPEIREKVLAQLGRQVYEEALDIASKDEGMSVSETRGISQELEEFLDQLLRERAGTGISRRE